MFLKSKLADAILYTFCTSQQEAGLVLKVDMSCLQHRIEILENENAHLIAERSKLQTQTVELKENDQKLQELQVTFTFDSFVQCQ